MQPDALQLPRRLLCYTELHVSIVVKTLKSGTAGMMPSGRVI